MEIDIARPDDLRHLAQVLWLHAAPDEQARQSVESFAVDLDGWWTAHQESHVCFVARESASQVVVGMAWLAVLPRVPRPGALNRRSADIQSVFVLPEHRGRGIGARLVRAAADHAARLGAPRVTVHSSRRAVPLYERVGFASSPQFLELHT